MFVLIVGGEKVGTNVTRTLRGLNHEIVLIEQDERRYESLEVEFEDGALYGDGPSCTYWSTPGSGVHPTSSWRSRATMRTTS